MVFLTAFLFLVLSVGFHIGSFLSGPPTGGHALGCFLPWHDRLGPRWLWQLAPRFPLFGFFSLLSTHTTCALGSAWFHVLSVLSLTRMTCALVSKGPLALVSGFLFFARMTYALGPDILKKLKRNICVF